MSITVDGVRLRKTKKSKFYLAIFFVAELLLSILLYASLAAHIIWPENSRALNEGPPLLIAYAGRLSDSAGNAVVNGTYCMRFSIYDNVTGGTQLWPAGTPTATTTTTASGLFSTLIGSSDILDYKFASTTAYLNTEVNNVAGASCTGSWEALTPRQRLAASAYAMTGSRVYGDLIKTFDVSNLVRIGTSTGAASPTLLQLDVKNTSDTVGAACTPSGTLWYNSVISKSLVCSNGLVQTFDNSSTTIAAIGTNGTTPISQGTVVFSNSNGVSFGLNGSTITASVAGAGGNTLSYYENMVPAGSLSMIGISQSTSTIAPFTLASPISASYLRFPVRMTTNSTTIGTTANTTVGAGEYSTFNAVIYSLGVGVNSLSLQSVASGSAGFTQQVSWQANANGSQYTMSNTLQFPQQGFTTNSFSTQNSITQTNFSFNTTFASESRLTGTRFIDIPFATSLAAGNYWLMLGMSTSSSAGANATNATQWRVNISNFYGASEGNWLIGPMGQALNASFQLNMGVGSFSTNGAAGTTASLNLSNISSAASHNLLYFQIINQGSH